MTRNSRIVNWLSVALLLSIAPYSFSSKAYFEYKARYIKNHDGDTITFLMEIYPDTLVLRNVRLYGIDTPEIYGKCPEEKARAIVARDYVEEKLSASEDIVVTVIDIGKYGRPVSLVKVDGKDLATDMIAKGFGRLYDGGTRLPWCGTHTS